MLTETRTDYKDGFRISISDTGSGGLTGGKGGKGSSQSVQEGQNTVRSKAYVKLLAALSEGKVHAFGDPDPLKAIYLDETPIKSKNGILNFKDVLIDYRVGTQDQDYIPGVASSVEREVQVGTQIKKINGALTRTITDPNLDAVRLRFMFPAMRTISEDQLKISGATVEFSIKLQSSGGTLTEVMRPVVTEKATSPFELANFHIPLTGNAPWNISVERITADSTSDRLQNDLYWQGYTEIIDAKLRYPNTALLFIQIDAEQFNSIPRLAVEMYGIQCLIPHNYEPFSRQYTGIFNGSLVPGWTNNPAWILYDILTNERYGLGERISRSMINISNFYSVAQYCDELVPDGFGGFEPRFRLNAYITNQEEAYKLLEDICSVFRAMPYSYGGTIELSQDRPRQPTKIFSPSNVVCEDESGNATPPFNYSSSALETRHTAAYVSWNDPNDFYKEAQVYYENPEAIARYGFNPIEARGFGITSRAQAYRYAKWLVEVAQNITNTVTFKVGSEGDLINIGEVFPVANPLKMQQRFYGRLRSGSTTTSLLLDEPITLDSSKTHQITLWNPITNSAEKRTIAFPQPQPNTLTLTSALSFVPPVDTVYQIESTVLKPKPFQCVSVVENGHQYELTGIDYYEGLYDSVDNDTQFTQPTGYSGFSDLRNPVENPKNLTVVESLYQAVGSGGIKIRADVGWSFSTSPWVTKYEFSYKKTGDPNFTTVYLDNVQSYTINDIEQGIYDFRVVAVNGLGARSSGLTETKSILGLIQPPSDVTGLRLNYYENYILLSWDASPDLDVRVGGSFKIKYSSRTSGATWFDGSDIAEVAGNQNTVQLPLLSGTFLIRTADSSGTLSQNVSSVITQNLPTIQNYLDFLEIDETGFPGTKLNVIEDGGQLKLSTDRYFDARPGLFDSQPGLFDDSAGATGAVVNQGIYNFSDSIDLGYPVTARIVSKIQASIVNQANKFDDIPGLFDDRQGLFDGQILDKASVTLQIRVSQDGLTFSDWQNFIIGDYLGRSFEFRALMKSDDPNQNIVIQSLGFSIFLPERVESRNVTTSAGSASLVNFSNSFITQPNVSISILNAQTGDRINSLTVTTTGFTVDIRDSADDIVSRSIAYFAQGYGKSA